MDGMKGTSWQQRYSANEIFTLRCRILDKPGMLAKVSELIGTAGGNIGDIKLVCVEDDYQIRDITVYLKDKGQLDRIEKSVNALDGADIIKKVNEILEIHRRGVIDVVSRVPIKTLTDLRMVYTPGVAQSCEEIVKNPQSAKELTTLCNTVAIITNGTAVLGLGDIGVVPSLPVMEGKAAIFAEFANISAIPILVDTKDTKKFIDTVMTIAPSFGAIQLEDVAAPQCFEIEEALREKLNIPVFHDDQHGTATVVLAALINAMKQTGRNPQDCKVIMLGAGAAGIAISKILVEYGIGDVVVYDSTGPIYRGRTEKMNPYKQQLAEITNKQNQQTPFAQGFEGKDIFVGVARPNMVTKEMVASMAKDSIVFPLSNPVGEITKEDAAEAGAAITADGRDCNNALVYPGIFRGALDANAPQITPKMQLAAAKTAASLAAEGDLLPDMLDRDVHKKIAQAVAESAKN